MTDADIITLSSEGQLAIPVELRKGFKDGDRLVVIRDGNRVVLERVDDVDDQLKDDLEFARRTKEARNRYERGEFRSMDFDEFIEQMKEW